MGVILIVVSMILGYEEPVESHAGKRRADAKQCSRVVSATVVADTGLAAAIEDGKLVVSFATVERGRAHLQRVVVSTLTEDSYAWDWEVSRDEGRTWWTLHHATFSRTERAV